MGKINPFFEVLKLFIISLNEISRNIFMFLPFIRSKKYLGQTKLDNKVVVMTTVENASI